MKRVELNDSVIKFSGNFISFLCRHCGFKQFFVFYKFNFDLNSEWPIIHNRACIKAHKYCWCRTSWLVYPYLLYVKSDMECEKEYWIQNGKFKKSDLVASTKATSDQNVIVGRGLHTVSLCLTYLTIWSLSVTSLFYLSWI